MKKTKLIMLYYTLITPINIWIGFELGIKNYKFAILLIFIVIVLEFHMVKYWNEA